MYELIGLCILFQCMKGVTEAENVFLSIILRIGIACTLTYVLFG